MNSGTVAKLIQLNREFYNRFGDSFSATRQKLQPGVMRIVQTIKADESILDLGCGNGNFLRELIARGHQAPLLGADFSIPLLRDAESASGAEWVVVDLSRLSGSEERLLANGNWDIVTMFATLHHIPSIELRLQILKNVKKILKPNGRFVLSNWQFLNSEKLKARIQPWERIGLTDKNVDEGDYLLDWRSGGEGLRYAHHFSAKELLGLADQTQMEVKDAFFSDGENGRLGYYQIWGVL